jgi:hypothetical protein
MNRDEASQMRRRSIQGTILLALGIIAAIAFAVTGSLWLIGTAMAFLVPGVVMLYQVGKSLS